MSNKPVVRERSNNAFVLVLFALLLVIAAAGSVLLILYPDNDWTRYVGIILALWACAIGIAALLANRRRILEADRRLENMRLFYEIQLDKEVLARAEYEQAVQAEMHRGLNEGYHNEIQELRRELRTLQVNLETMLGSSLQQSISSLEAASKKLEITASQRVVNQEPRPKQREEAPNATVNPPSGNFSQYPNYAEQNEGQKFASGPIPGLDISYTGVFPSVVRPDAHEQPPRYTPPQAPEPARYSAPPSQEFPAAPTNPGQYEPQNYEPEPEYEPSDEYNEYDYPEQYPAQEYDNVDSNPFSSRGFPQERGTEAQPPPAQKLPSVGSKFDIPRESTGFTEPQERPSSNEPPIRTGRRSRPEKPEKYNNVQPITASQRTAQPSQPPQPPQKNFVKRGRHSSELSGDLAPTISDEPYGSNTASAQEEEYSSSNDRRFSTYQPSLQELEMRKRSRPATRSLSDILAYRNAAQNPPNNAPHRAPPPRRHRRDDE